MGIFKIKKQKDRVIVEVSLPALPILAKEAEKVRQVVREGHVREYLKSKGIVVKECLQAQKASNLSGDAATGLFIFAINPNRPRVAEKTLKAGEEVKKVIKDLTPEVEPVIMKEQPKKRKRVRRDSTTGNKTTS